MSDSGSEPKKDEVGAYAESDDRETQLGYGHGGVPFYIAIVWVAFLIAYIVVMVTLGLPDFKSWASR